MGAHRRETAKRESERRFARQERERGRRARSEQKRERRQARHGRGLDAMLVATHSARSGRDD